MPRMPQKLLVLILLLTIPCFSSTWRLEVSISKGADGLPMRRPMGVSYDPIKKRLYIVDSGNNRLLSFSLNGEPLSVFNAGGSLKKPVYMEKDKDGNLVVVERGENVVKKIDLKARKITSYKLSRGNGRSVLIGRILRFGKTFLVIDRISGEVLVYDQEFRFVKNITPHIRDFNGFIDIKIKEGKLWGMEVLTGRIFCLSLDKGSLVKKVELNKELVRPVSFELDRSGNIYVLDRYMGKILVFSPDGRFMYSFSRKGFREGRLYYPWFLLFVGNKLLVLDEGNGRLDVWVRQ